ncbi:MAG TPA: DUF4232 domain-containing protein [Magnetospirillaceae bacterium]|nr:DUF4232 domain-containing protein [Magnetospirillaceae bacterium]
MAGQDESVQPKSKFAWLWIVLAVILALAAVGALWWWKMTSQTSAATCLPKNLTLSLGETERITGTSYVHVVVTNKGKESCTLEGYPTVSALDSKGENYVTSVAQINPFYTSRVVTVAPKGQAYVAVGIPDADPFDAGVCSDASATLRLYLPAEAITPISVPLTTDFAYKICPGFSVTVFMPGA